MPDGEKWSPGHACSRTTVVHHHIAIAVGLERNELERHFHFGDFALDQPFGRPQRIVPVPQVVAIIKNAPHLYVRKRKRLHLDTQVVAFDYDLIERLSFEGHNGTIGVDGSAADLLDRKPAAVV